MQASETRARKATRKLLLVCGIAFSLMYVAGDIGASLRWEGYSYTAQTVSELMAVEAPTRPLLVALFSLYNALVLTFGAGLLVAAGTKRTLRVTGWLVLGWSAVGTVVLLFLPMHSRGAVGTMTVSDGMHIALTGVGVLLAPLYTGFGAASLGKRFRLYSIGTILALVVFGALAELAGPRVAATLPTPGVGLLERINVYATMLWLWVLAVAVLKERGCRDAAAGLLSGCRAGSAGGAPQFTHKETTSWMEDESR